LVSIEPKILANSDRVITLDQIKSLDLKSGIKAIIIRTTPNDNSKKTRQYSNTNPPYIDKEAMQFIIDQGINHFLIDTPSVDREMDNGELASHHVFWEYPNSPKTNRTITELVYVSNSIKDDLYLLNLQIASFENDASPSKPVLFEIEELTH
jgi:kynurenine formamidase